MAKTEKVRHRFVYGLLLVVLYGVSQLTCREVPNSRRAEEVRFFVAGHYFESLPYRVREFRARSSRESLASRFQGLKGRRVPYGVYDYILVRTDVARPNMTTISGTVNIKHPEQWITVQPTGLYLVNSTGEEMIADYGFPNFEVIEGEVLGLPGLGAETWIRFYLFPGGQTVDVPVHSDGRFRVFEPLHGWVIAVVIEGARVIYTEPIMVEDPTTVGKIKLRIR